MNEQILEMCQIRNNSLVIYKDFSGFHRKKSAFEKYIAEKRALMLGVRKERYSGLITNGVKKRLSKAVNLLVASTLKKVVFSKQLNKYVTHQISFITLTIPDSTALGAKELHKKMLEPMIKFLRQVHGMRSYVWKVEYQKRGVLHYHLTSDCYIDHNDLRKKWNSLLTKNELNTAYIDAKGHINANSTDIHSVRNIQDLPAYLVKYMIKSYQNEKSVNGKIWDCSKNLKAARYYTTEFTGDIEQDVYDLQAKGVTTIKEFDNFRFVKFNGCSAVYFMPQQVKDAYYSNLRAIREHKIDLFSQFKVKKKVFVKEVIKPLAQALQCGKQLYLFN